MNLSKTLAFLSILLIIVFASLGLYFFAKSSDTQKADQYFQNVDNDALLNEIKSRADYKSAIVSFSDRSPRFDELPLRSVSINFVYLIDKRLSKFKGKDSMTLTFAYVMDDSLKKLIVNSAMPLFNGQESTSVKESFENLNSDNAYFLSLQYAEGANLDTDSIQRTVCEFVSLEECSELISNFAINSYTENEFRNMIKNPIADTVTLSFEDVLLWSIKEIEL